MRYLALALPALVALSPARADGIMGNDTCKARIAEGMALMSQDKYNEALAKFEEARKADPKASGPLSHRALLFYSASTATAKENVENYRKEAERAALAALELDPGDIMASKVLGLLENPDSHKHHEAPAKAKEALEEAEKLYQARQFEAAFRKYEEAVQLDPQYDQAIVFAGDALYLQGKNEEAILWFRKALAVNPRNEQAWRFLADALLKLDRVEEAREALTSAISILPRYGGAWERLASLPQMDGRAWKRFMWRPRSRTQKEAGTLKVLVDEEIAQAKDREESLDGEFWIMYALAEASAGLPPEGKAGATRPAPPITPFQAQQRNLDQACKTVSELQEKGKGKGLRDPMLLQLQAFHAGGDLKAAIFLLMFRESYRPDFEAWKKANPGAVKAFLEKYRLRP